MEARCQALEAQVAVLLAALDRIIQVGSRSGGDAFGRAEDLDLAVAIADEAQATYDRPAPKVATDTLDLDRLERLERRATPLKWCATKGVKVGYLHRIGSHGPRIAKCYLGPTEEVRDGMPDAEFLAELRNSCTALIARARKADQLERQLPDAVREVTVAAINGVGEVLTAQRDAARREVNRLRAVLRPFAEYAKARARMPLRGLSDIIHAIHTGSEYEAELRLSDCNTALAALEALEPPSSPTEQPR